MRFRSVCVAVAAFFVLTACEHNATEVPTIDSGAATTSASATPVPAPASTTTEAPAPASANTDPSMTVVEIVSSLPTAPIEGDSGIELTFEVTGLPAGMSLWVVDFTDRYYVVSHDPVATSDGTYTTFDGPLGSGRERVTVTFVVANRAGSDTLGANANRSGDIAFDTLPAGLTNVKEVPIQVR